MATPPHTRHRPDAERISVTDARNQIGSLARRVSRTGREIVLTLHGDDLATISPLPPIDPEPVSPDGTDNPAA